MSATPTNSPDACANADPAWALDWVLDQVDGLGQTRALTVRVAPPVLCAEPFHAWRSILVMEGRFSSDIPIYGATAIQALALAVSMAITLLTDAAAEGELTDRVTGEPVTIDVLNATWGVRNLGGL